MKVLLKQVFVASETSSFANKIVDIAVENGIITEIENFIEIKPDYTVINCTDCYITNGWIDIFCYTGEPGNEANETLESFSNAAFEGGVTTLFALPNTKPVIDNKSLVVYLQSLNNQLPVNILPYGSITQKIEGKQLAEMFDMYNAGAIAFTDGLLPLQTAGVMLKALQYVKAFNGVIVQMPIDKSIGAKGVMNEGIISVQLGLPGIPAISEELIIKRDIDLLEYTNSKLHFTGITTKKAIDLIREAKMKGLQVTCSCTPYHLLFCEDDLQNYNTYLKVNPPLRTKADKEALQQAVFDGIIDCITSHHLPEIVDHKTCDFIDASFGVIGVQTAYSSLITALPQLSAVQINNLMVSNAAKIFNINLPYIEVGNICNTTVFTTKKSYNYNLLNNKSKAINTPLMNTNLNGKVIATINGKNIQMQPNND